MTKLQAPTDEETQGRGADARAGPGAVRRFVTTLGFPVLFAGLVLGGWYGFSGLVLDPDRRFLVPFPHDVVDVSFLDSANRDLLMDGLQTTTEVALVGLLISIGLGLLFATLMTQSLWIERAFYPWAVVLQTVPVLALVPLIGLWFGFGFTGRVIVVVLISLFPIIINSLFGMQSAPQGLHDLLSLHHAKRSIRFRKLELRAAVPAIFAGFRIAAGLSVIGAIVGEFFFQRGEPGIGNLINLYRGRLRTEELFGALFLSSLLGIVVFWVFTLIGNKLTRHWHESAAEA